MMQAVFGVIIGFVLTVAMVIGGVLATFLLLAILTRAVDLLAQLLVARRDDRSPV